MVLVLPGVEKKPSFSSRLGASLGGGIQSGMSDAMRFAQKMALQDQKSQSKQSFLSDLFGSKTSQESSQQEEDFKLTPQQETVLALQDPTAFNAYKHLKESRLKEVESINQKENLTGTLQEMTKTLLEGNLGLTPSKFLTAKGRRDKQYFDSLNTQLESIGKEMVSKGVLSAPRFAFLLSNLPSSDKTDAANAGAIQAWGKELGIPVSEDLKSLYEEKPKSKKRLDKSSSSSIIVMRDKEGNIYHMPPEVAKQAREQGFVEHE